MRKWNGGLGAAALLVMICIGIAAAGSRKTTVPERSEAEALMIGDSRTVGLAEHGQLDGTHFFASMGMTVRSAPEQRISVARVGKVTLAELLDTWEYDKIYIMLGINELEEPAGQTADAMKTLVRQIRDLQPRAQIILLGNLHVTAIRSAEDPWYNNPAIDRLNTEISGLADGQQVFYLDSNGLTDDAQGALDPARSADHAHLTSRGYREWGAWLQEQTQRILKEGGQAT